MSLKGLKKLKGFSILIIPTGGGIEAKSRQFSFNKATFIIGIYSVVLLFLGFFALNLTPLKGIFFSNGAKLSQSDRQIVDELNQKLIFLTRELENLKLTNQQLQNAILLGDSSLIDSSTKKVKQKKHAQNPYGGNIFSVINYLLSGNQTSPKGEIYFTLPATGFISRGFNPNNGHMGIDIVVKTGTPIFAAASGYVIFADYTTKDGYMVMLGHSDGYITVYKHCSELLVKARDMVTEGEIIALSGNTGEITTGPHLHFEIWKDGKPIDPKNLLIIN